MKRLLIAGNWKMNKTIKETEEFVSELLEKLPKTKNEVLICPPYLAIKSAKEKCEGVNLQIGAQNMHYLDNGAFTGEISGKMLQEVGVEYVIIGHSSRRTYDNETDEKINLKIKKALELGMTPILCIGENAKQREQNRTYRVLKKQLNLDLDGITELDKVVIAYEPLWAISDGVNPAPTPTIEVISAINSGIKRVLRQMFGKELVKKSRILYGGSVTGENAGEILNERSVSGVLVGGASMNVDKFVKIIEASNR